MSTARQLLTVGRQDASSFRETDNARVVFFVGGLHNAPEGCRRNFQTIGRDRSAITLSTFGKALDLLTEPVSAVRWVATEGEVLAPSRVAAKVGPGLPARSRTEHQPGPTTRRPGPDVRRGHFRRLARCELPPELLMQVGG